MMEKDIPRVNGGWAQAMVGELKAMFRDEGVVIFLVLMPLFYPLLYSWIYTNEVAREVPVAVVDMSHTAMSREFVRLMDASPDVKVASRCSDMEQAKWLVAHEKAFGVIYIPEGFERNVLRMDQSVVSVYCDMGFMLYYKAIMQTATEVAGKVNNALQRQRAQRITVREEELATEPLLAEAVPIFNVTGGYGNFIIPGVLMLVLQQTLLLGIGMMAGTRRERDGRLVPANAPLASTLTGRVLAYLALYAVNAAYVTLVVPRLFSFTSLVHGADLLCLLLPYLLACIMLAMTLGYAVRRREDIFLMVVFSSVPLLFMTGVSWPQSAIPGIWQYFSMLFPSTFGMRAFVRMNTMEATLHDVGSECVMLWCQALFYSLMVGLLAWRERRHLKRQQAGSINDNKYNDGRDTD